MTPPSWGVRIARAVRRSTQKPQRTGLRELKRMRTHATIVRVSLELFAERGYEATTLAEIAAGI